MTMTLTQKLYSLVTESSDLEIIQTKINHHYIRYTYAQFYQTAQAVAYAITDENFNPGDRIAMGLKNAPVWGMIYFGIQYAGAIAVPFDYQSKKEDIFYFLNHSESKILFIHEDLAKMSDDLFLNCPLLKKIVIVEGHDVSEKERVFLFDHFIKKLDPSFKHLDHVNDVDSIASILYTSGTTAQPKGVMLTHRNFYENFNAIEKLGYLTSRRHNILSILPLHHAFPFTVTLLTPLFSKNKITYLSSVKSTDLLPCMQETQVTILVGVPQLFYMLQRNMAEQIKKSAGWIRFLFSLIVPVTYSLRKMTRLNLTRYFLWKIHKNFGRKFQYLICGGAKFDPAVKQFLCRIGFSLIEGYGLTETAPVVSFNPSNSRYWDSVGKPIPGVDIKIDSPDTQGIGEVLIKGPNVMKGYFRMPDETAVAIQAGWFYSGDLGYIHSDGHLFLTGRKNELIVLSSGKNISPEELESHYLKSPFIKEICILPVPMPDKEILKAVIVPNMEYLQKHRGSNITGSISFAIENFSRELPPYKRILGFVLSKEELPRTRLGKLKRYVIRDKFLPAFTHRKSDSSENTEPAYSESDQIILESTLFKKTAATIVQQQKSLEKPIRLDDHLEIDLGFDSLGRVELFTQLESLFHLRANMADMETVFTVRDLIKMLEDTLQKQDGSFVCAPKSWNELLSDDINPTFLELIDPFPNPYRTFLLKNIHHFLRCLFRLFWHIKISGLENIPASPPYIICPNHASFMDAPVVGSSLPFSALKETFFLGFSEYFEASLLKYTTKVCKVVPINAGARLLDALQVAARILKNGNAICIFPEGERSIDGMMRPFKKGVGILVKELNIPILPVYIHGTFQAWPRTRRYPKFHPIQVTFGKLCSPEELKQTGQAFSPQNDYEAITLGIREKMLALQS